jgi:hypothetical protein
MTVTDDTSMLATNAPDVYKDIPAAATAVSIPTTDSTSMLSIDKR